MEPDLPARLLAEAQRYTPPPARRSRLMPLREVILTYLANGASYETIAAFLNGHGVVIQASTVGYFRRRYCPASDITRVQRQLAAATTATPALAASPSVAAASSSNGSGKRRNPRIARDDL